MMAPRPSEAAERPLKDLFSELSGELSFIVSREAELAKTEMSQKASLAAKAAVLSPWAESPLWWRS